VPAAEQPLGDHGVRRIARAGDHRQDDAERVDGCAAAAQHEQQDAGAGERGGRGPAARQRLTVRDPPGQAGDRGRRAEGDDRPDGDPGPVDGGEEGELVGRDRDGDQRQLPPWPGRGHGGDGARHEEEERAADGDARGADGHGGGVRAERLGRARRAEAHGAEEDEHPSHVCDCSTIPPCCQAAVARKRGDTSAA
jgi:hypothetical protein